MMLAVLVVRMLVVRVVGMRVVHAIVRRDVLVRMLARECVRRVRVGGELGGRRARARAD